MCWKSGYVYHGLWKMRLQACSGFWHCPVQRRHGKKPAFYAWPGRSRLLFPSGRTTSTDSGVAQRVYVAKIKWSGAYRTNRHCCTISVLLVLCDRVGLLTEQSMRKRLSEGIVARWVKLKLGT